jgi:hypothetical protein
MFQKWSREPLTDEEARLAIFWYSEEELGTGKLVHVFRIGLDTWCEYSIDSDERAFMNTCKRVDRFGERLSREPSDLEAALADGRHGFVVRLAGSPFPKWYMPARSEGETAEAALYAITDTAGLRDLQFAVSGIRPHPALAYTEYVGEPMPAEEQLARAIAANRKP